MVFKPNIKLQNEHVQKCRKLEKGTNGIGILVFMSVLLSLVAITLAIMSLSIYPLLLFIPVAICIITITNKMGKFEKVLENNPIIKGKYDLSLDVGDDSIFITFEDTYYNTGDDETHYRVVEQTILYPDIETFQYDCKNNLIIFKGKMEESSYTKGYKDSTFSTDKQVEFEYLLADVYKDRDRLIYEVNKRRNKYV